MAYFDGASGLLHRAVFSSRSLYKQEQRRIFSRCWLFVGPENWAEAPGDYFTASMGETPVVCWRPSTGQLSIFVNECPAGDGTLADCERGSGTELVCSCHGLRYRSDGTAEGQPHLRATTAAKLATYHGLIFASFDSGASSLASHLGDFAWYLDMLVNRREGGVEVIGGAAFRWTIDANWKVAAEAFAGDAYRDLTMHAATNAVTLNKPPSTAGQGLQIAAGAGALTVLTDTSLYTPATAIDNYERAVAAETEARLGADRGGQLIPLTGTLFPNLSFDWRSRSLHVWQPRGVGKTEITTYCFVDRAAPEAVRQAMRKACQLYFGPGGLKSHDQVGPWQSLTERAGHMLSGRLPLNLQMGLGHMLSRNLPGKVSDLFSEMNQRSFYTWWEERLNQNEDAAPGASKLQIASSNAAMEHGGLKADR